jgi:hypothetical protein
MELKLEQGAPRGTLRAAAGEISGRGAIDD